ncbi:MAG: hypothetical protein FWC43_13965, partial [Planctomycetaceae bacterium]|nr:hypothetical protein [Planctomycetaceae bacterium]
MRKIKYLTDCIKKGDMPIIVQAIQILQEYEGYRLTLRQLFCQFVARNLLPNKDKMYNKLCVTIKRGRMGGLIDWDIIEDRTRFLRSLPHWNSPANIIVACADQYHVDFWQNQKCRVEVWIEKDALIGVIEETCDHWDVPIFSCRGYGITSKGICQGESSPSTSLYRDRHFAMLHSGFYSSPPIKAGMKRS